MLWVYGLGHLLWILSSAVLFFGLTCGRAGSGRRLVYPWLLMMVFSHLTTASTLFELCGMGLGMALGGEASSQTP